MRSIQEHAEFPQLTQLSEKLYIRALIDHQRYSLYEEDLTPTPEYPRLRAQISRLQDTYQAAITAVYQACGQLPLVAQIIYAPDGLPFQIDLVTYLVFAEGVLVNFECQEAIFNFEGEH